MLLAGEMAGLLYFNALVGKTTPIGVYGVHKIRDLGPVLGSVP
jgi:hypothetical protein